MHRIKDFTPPEGVQFIIQEFSFASTEMNEDRTFTFLLGGGTSRGHCYCNLDNGSALYSHEDCDCQNDCSCYSYSPPVCKYHACKSDCDCQRDCGCDMNF